MRCPKCSFVSFDLVETCVKCGKNINTAADDLQGTIVGVPAPSFLKLPGQEAPPEAAEETAEVGTEEELDLGVEGEEAEMDFSLDEEPSDEAEDFEMDLSEADDEVTIDLADEDEPEMDLGFEEEEVAEEPQPEEEEAIGISDLVPSEEAEDVQVDEPVEEELEVAVDEAEPEAAAAGQGLEDLKVEGIDLDTGSGEVDPDKVVPSVKTGTALDDFDVDLGDLMTSKD